MNRIPIRTIYKKVIVIFFVFMMVMTFLSRVMDSFTVAVVKTEYYKKGKVLHKIKGEAVFIADETRFVQIPENMKIVKIDKQVGDYVEAGESLFYLDVELLKEKQRKLLLDLEKYKLELEEEILSEYSSAGISDTTVAEQSLESAVIALESGKEELEQVRQECSQKLEVLKKEYERNLNQSEEEAEKEGWRAWKTAKSNYDAALARQKNMIKKAQWVVDDCRKKLNQLLEQGEDDQETALAQTELDRAEAELEQTILEQGFEVEQARITKVQAEEDYGNISGGATNRTDSLTSAYEASVEAQLLKIQGEEKNVKSLEEAVRQARQNLENAKINDGVQQQTRERQKKSSQLRQESKRFDLEEQNRQIKEVDLFIQNGGAVTAKASGIVTTMDLEVGSATNGSEKVQIGVDGIKLKSTVDKKTGDFIKSGQEFTFKIPDDNQKYHAEVESCSFNENDSQFTIISQIQDEIGRVGQQVDFTLETESGPYEKVIPIEGLRQDNQGYYLYITEKRKTILGEELAVVKISVDLIKRSSTQAAVEGMIGPDTPIILSSNKIIEENDRVRIK